MISLEKDYNEFMLHYNKQTVEEHLIERAVKTTIQKLYEKSLFENCPNANEVLQEFLFVTRTRVDLEKVNDFVVQKFCS